MTYYAVIEMDAWMKVYSETIYLYKEDAENHLKRLAEYQALVKEDDYLNQYTAWIVERPTPDKMIIKDGKKVK
jgi:hypothetical protein